MLKANYDYLTFKLDAEKHKSRLEKIKTQPAPDFEKTQPDLGGIEKEAKKYKKYKNIILIGNGGSRTSSWAFYNALFEFRNKVNFAFLSSAEPDLIRSLRKKYSKRDTLALAISKSGDNINAVEPLLLMKDYPVLVVTGKNSNPFRRMAEIKKWPVFEHPEVGGRFSGMTACALFPAALMGLPLEEIYAGACDGYKEYNSRAPLEKNAALKLALALYELEQRGYVEIFTSIYSTALSEMLPLITQLIHESVGKNGKGQTIYGGYSPETHHHTNQRFFGGVKNAVGLFWGVENRKGDMAIKIPKNLAAIPFKDRTVGSLNGILAGDTMKYDMGGAIGHAKEEKIPAVEIWTKEITERSVGECMVFWQYVAFYASLLRDIDPFNQPEVERAKVISFKLRTGK
ncbi:MAG: Glucose-6-phosphate isomerase [Patescibacteria group bacterium]|nr:Glucose-6-phosphate isomerase [Patescibacteria group bacterium]